MKSILSQMFSLGIGAAVTTKDQLEKVFDELIAKGELSRAESKEMLQQFTEKASSARQELDSQVKTMVYNALRGLNLAAKSEVEELKRRIEILEQKQQ